MLKHMNIRVAGRVQGVFFRASVMKKARKLGLTGFVRNEAGGGVYIEAEGGADDLDQLVAWCSQGSRSAQVTEVVAEPAAVQNFRDFLITS